MTGVLSKLVAGVALASALWLAPVSSAFAAPPPGGPGAHPHADAPAANRVKVEVLVVYANNSGQVDTRLNGLERQLRSMPQFTGFSVLSSHSDTLAPSQSTSFTFEGGRKMDVTVLGRTDEQARVRIELFNPAHDKTLDTTVSIPRGKTMIVGGLKYQDGKLVLPVSVEY